MVCPLFVFAQGATTKPVKPSVAKSTTSRPAPVAKKRSTPPTRKSPDAKAPVKRRSVKTKTSTAKKPSKQQAKKTQPKQAKKKLSVELNAFADKFRKDYWEKGPLVALFLILLVGFGVSLTPCVYPMIPITIAVIGASNESGHKHRGKGFLLSFTYVLGMAVPAVVLGLVVSQLGSLPFVMGGIMKSKIFLVLIIGLFTLMSISMFGAFELTLPASWQTKLAGFQGSGFSGVFILGMIGIILSTACSGPVMLGLLAFIAQTGSWTLGILLPFVFALGIGIPFLILGSGVVEALPRSGKWMLEIKKVFGVILLGAAIFYSYYLFQKMLVWYALGLGVILLSFSVFSGAFRGYEEGRWWWDHVKQIFGLLCFFAGTYLFVGTLLTSGFLLPPVSKILKNKVVVKVPAPTVITTHTKAVGGVPAKRAVKKADKCLPPADYPANKPFWITSEKEGLACAKKLKRPAIIDFWAVWCKNCKELERTAFGHPDVIKESRRFVMIKAEYDKDEKEMARFTKQYRIPGLPWVRFFDSKGKMLQKPLIVGLLTPQKVLKLMQQVR
tara:strand:- start:2462 stop:4126 length:1665 start_codon:yes stop_codon:yes gene_type:complete